MAFQEINTDGGDKFRFVNAGDKIEGHYLGDSTLNIGGKEVMRHTFKTKTGTVSVLGSYKINEVMEKVVPGQLVRLTYTGVKKLPGGKTLKNFKLEIDTTDTIAVLNTAKPTNTTEAAIASMRGE